MRRWQAPDVFIDRGICGLNTREQHLVIKKRMVNGFIQSRQAEQPFFFCGEGKEIFAVIIKEWLDAHVITGTKKLLLLLIPYCESEIADKVLYAISAIVFIQQEHDATIRDPSFFGRVYVQQIV